MCWPEQDDPKFKAAMRTRNPEQRLRAFLALCGGKRFDEETGAPQPAYRMDSMRIMAEFPKPKVPFCLCPVRMHARRVQAALLPGRVAEQTWLEREFPCL